MNKFEHFGLNVPNAKAMSEWYVENLNMQVLLDNGAAYFMGDEEGKMCVELYTNPKAPVPNYGEMHHLTMHFAFAVENAVELSEKLLGNGATLVEKLVTDDESVLIMLRDPWGMPLQLCQRTVKF